MTTPNNLSLVGAPSFVAGAAGFGQALACNGATQYAVAQRGGVYDFAANVSFTVEAWLTSSSTTGLQIAFSCFTPSVTGTWYLGFNNGKAIGALGSTNVTSSASYANGARHHLALTYNGSTGVITLYVDGVSQGTVTPTYSGIVNGQVYIGARNSSTFFFNGTVDECAISTGLLYTSNFTPPSAPFSNTRANQVALWHLDGTGEDSNQQLSVSQLTLTAGATATVVVNLDTATWSGAGSLSLSGSTGTTITSQTVNSATQTTLVLAGGDTIGSVVITDAQSGLTATLQVVYPNLYVEDTLTDSAGTLLDAHGALIGGPWVPTGLGAVGAAQFDVNDTIMLSGASAAYYLATQQPASATYSIKIPFKYFTGSVWSVGAVAYAPGGMGSAQANYYLGQFHQSSWYITIVQAGLATHLATVADARVTANTVYWLLFTVAPGSQTLAVSYDGGETYTQVLQTTDATWSGPGYAGLYLSDPSGAGSATTGIHIGPGTLTVRTMPTLTPSPATLTYATTGNTMVVTSSLAIWQTGSTPLTLRGANGVNLVTATTINSPTQATLTVNAGTAVGALTLTDAVSGAIASVPVQAAGTLSTAITSLPRALTTTVTPVSVPLVGGSTQWTSTAPTFTASGAADTTVLGVTVTDDTHCTISVAPGHLVKTATILDSTTGATVTIPIVSSQVGPVNMIGDSYTAGNGASSGATQYTAVFAADTGLTITNKGVSGSGVEDNALSVYGVTPQAGSLNTYMLGYNDAKLQNALDLLTAVIEPGWWAALTWLTLINADVLAASGAGVTRAGSWTNAGWHTAMSTSHTGDTITAQNVAGTVVYVGYLLTTAAAGTFSVLVDGISYGPYTCQSSTTPLTATRMAGVARIGGLQNGTHSVQVVANAAGGPVSIDWIGANGMAGATVVVGGIAHSDATGYASFPPHNYGSDAIMDAYNAALLAVINTLCADGLDVRYADLDLVFLLTTDLYTDHVHPNDLGHQHIASAFAQTVMTVPLAPVTTTATQAASLAQIQASLAALTTTVTATSATVTTNLDARVSSRAAGDSQGRATLAPAGLDAVVPEVPSAPTEAARTANIVKMLTFLYLAQCSGRVVTDNVAHTETVYANDGVTELLQAGYSDTGTVFTRNPAS